MPISGSDTRRCQRCRYWFNRCCHALALLEGDDGNPGHCHHFTVEAMHLFTERETQPCSAT